MPYMSREGDLTKISSENCMSPMMRSSAMGTASMTDRETLHYTVKYWIRLNPNDAIRPQSTSRDVGFFGNVMTRLFLLPIWLPYWFWNRRKKRIEMTEFVVAGTSGRLADGELIGQLVLEWVESHPRDFVFGEYDPMVSKLERSFEKILSEST